MKLVYKPNDGNTYKTKAKSFGGSDPDFKSTIGKTYVRSFTQYNYTHQWYCLSLYQQVTRRRNKQFSCNVTGTVFSLLIQYAEHL